MSPFLLAGLLACGTESPPQAPSSAGVSLWSEFETLDEVEAALDTLSRHGLALNRSVVLGELDADDLERFLRAAERKGVPVRLWPELSPEEGRWPSVATRHSFIPFAEDLMALVRERDLPVDTIYIDLEPPLTRGLELQRALEEPGANPITVLTQYFEGKVADPDFEAARADYAALAEAAHSEGFKIHLTTLPFILDDFADGDPTIQRAMESPVSGIAWDECSFQVYTTLLSGLLGLPLGPDLVYSYGRTTVELFGEKAALDLGTFLGKPDTFSGTAGYEDPSQLEADVRAAVAAGIPPERLHIFSLEGLISRPDPDPWFNWDLNNPSPPPTSATTTAVREFLSSLDRAYP
ncbi:MAG: hypothetical protein HYY13_06815 [Nitrospirae bacterium]|nr:hypothetical protein [Nitrospirota bacterium]